MTGSWPLGRASEVGGALGKAQVSRIEGEVSPSGAGRGDGRVTDRECLRPCWGWAGQLSREKGDQEAGGGSQTSRGPPSPGQRTCDPELQSKARSHRAEPESRCQLQGCGTGVSCWKEEEGQRSTEPACGGGGSSYPQPGHLELVSLALFRDRFRR